LITDPSNAYDELTNILWLVGGIEEGREGRCFLRIVPNRRRETMTNVLRLNILPNSILVTDGHPSYPGAANDLNFDHIIVNHSEGFTNSDGDHTNLIENLWSHLKTLMRGRHGILYENWNDFVAEFIFRKNFLRDHSPASMLNVYKIILQRLFIN
jgi:hypothetical protein